MSKLNDLTGKKFNRLTVIKRIENNKHNQSQWLCKCDCGNMVVVVAAHLKNGHTKSCGCIRAETSYAIDLTGQRFGRLTVIERAENIGKKTMWKCRCDCGNEKIIRADDLKSGRSKSCGCYNKEKTIISHTTHRGTGTRLYSIWSLMKDRCTNKNNKGYKYYGGRGITVCDEWMHDFQAFYDWSMSNGYADDLTIDRIDNDGNYEPSNCRWATQKEQQNNRRNNHLLTYNGKTYTIAELSELFGIDKDVFRIRINNNWSIERALTQKIKKKKN